MHLGIVNKEKRGQRAVPVFFLTRIQRSLSSSLYYFWYFVLGAGGEWTVKALGFRCRLVY